MSQLCSHLHLRIYPDITRNGCNSFTTVIDLGLLLALFVNIFAELSKRMDEKCVISVDCRGGGMRAPISAWKRMLGSISHQLVDSV